MIPVFNDWDSLKQVIKEINEIIEDLKDIYFECVVINDASTINRPKLIKPNNIDVLEILNMKENKGHARCNAFGIRYIFQNKKFDNLILMDGDGEDRPEEIREFIKQIDNSDYVLVDLKSFKIRSIAFFDSSKKTM